ncbi:hypothetical protein VaNZ11_014214 [Volvox africanus]|uniref:Uncharacterized protein n=1 Tax=Volvox africanus TaxID=51714 RepID=A0ABQ5SIW2_9CHLO|nr:hypothetical protein VaNZ11_014214 [Volvox africanus]
MRRLQKHLAGLGGQAFCKPWPRFISTNNYLESEVQTSYAGGRPDADAAFLQLLSQSFLPSATESNSSFRPVLANLPASADLLEHAVQQTPIPQPLYDLPTFLATSYPQAGVRPCNPGYDWCSWARSNLPQAEKSAAQASNVHQKQGEQLALLWQMDAHLQFPISRQALLRIAKMELAHLWNYQQQQHLLSRNMNGGEGLRGTWGECQPREVAAIPANGEGVKSMDFSLQTNGHGRREASGRRADFMFSEPPPAVDQAMSGVHDLKEDEDDIFSAADRKARVRAAQEQHRKDGKQQQVIAAHVAVRDPLSALPPDVQVRLRELQRRAEAYSQKSGAPLLGVIRNVGEAFGQRVSYGKAVHGFESNGGVSHDSTVVSAAALQWAGIGLQRRPMAGPADLQLMNSDTSTFSPTYWTDHPLLSYTDNIVALAARETAARRAKTAERPAGSFSSAAAVTSISAALQQPIAHAGVSASRAPATPVLTLLLDHLKVKYLDVLHAWEVAARLCEATEREVRETERRRAEMIIQVGDMLPVALRCLALSWGQAAASFRHEVLAPMLHPSVRGLTISASAAAVLQQTAQQTLLEPLDWNRAVKMLQGQSTRFTAAAGTMGPADAATGAASTAANTAAAAGDLHTAVRHVMAPLLAAAAARHQSMLSGQEYGAVTADGKPNPSSRSVGTVASSSTPVPGAMSPAAGVVCFRETLVLDASSAFDDSSQNCRVSLEFDVDRLAASEPALGGSWWARFLERLLAPQCDLRKRRKTMPGGSMAGRARRSAVAQSARMALVYPVDVERSFCRRSRIATLSTARYATREANRKLLLEHYTALLRVAAQAATGAAVTPGGQSMAAVQ